MAYKMKGWSGWSPLKQVKRVPKKGTDIDKLMEEATEFEGTKTLTSKQNGDEDGVPRKDTRGAPLETPTGTSGKTLKNKYEAMEAVANIGDEIEFLNEDYFNDRISKSQYDAKMKILRMKEDASIKANKATIPTQGLNNRPDPKWENADEVD